ncbi:PSP1 domain-containing protein [Desulfogranum mediterraneum]|uniref:PSP1 domain-containing protein n=1 Tax=Desulfogranum mediterraneum TaxID=160661 RepID=UPI00048AE1B1|nr:regulatory iron-sulfur-containing complex subunit RicT [Desulfogranum mediterraneum]
MSELEPEQDADHVESREVADGLTWYYRLRFRQQGQEFTAEAHLHDLGYGDTVIVKTDHGNEPAIIVGRAAGQGDPDQERPVSYLVHRPASADEEEKYQQLPFQEKSAYAFCQRQVGLLKLPMHLVRVERFFNGSKIIFYFTAENRVDFRELVKVLVQEFRTRVEMRQIGVRHETQMIGGLGSCGRELCCSSYLKKFESVSIKMAKTQDLPLNPAKISGVCNRLLCCLTYEYETYRKVKKGMPRVGRSLRYEGEVYKIIRQVPLTGTLLALNSDGEERVFVEDEWRAAEILQKAPARKGQGRKGAPGSPSKKGK